jgi:putative transcriptional regulator
MIRILFTMWLALAGLAWGDADLSKPVFLVSRPDMGDPNFHDSVVLLTHSGPLGAVGVIVNRRTEVPLARALPDAESRLGPDDRLFFGGPVGPRVMSFVFRAPEGRPGALKIAEGAWASSNEDLIAELLKRDKPTEGLRVFAGLAGWAPGQLEEEIDRGDWRKLPVDAHSLFDVKPELLWAELDRRASAIPVRYNSARASR